jgi:hypothetical protein
VNAADLMDELLPVLFPDFAVWDYQFRLTIKNHKGEEIVIAQILDYTFASQFGLVKRLPLHRSASVQDNIERDGLTFIGFPLWSGQVKDQVHIALLVCEDGFVIEIVLYIHGCNY